MCDLPIRGFSSKQSLHFPIFIFGLLLASISVKYLNNKNLYLIASLQNTEQSTENFFQH
jgi:hypothetical protein